MSLRHLYKDLNELKVYPDTLFITPKYNVFIKRYHVENLYNEDKYITYVYDNKTNLLLYRHEVHMNNTFIYKDDKKRTITSLPSNPSEGLSILITLFYHNDVIRSNEVGCLYEVVTEDGKFTLQENYYKDNTLHRNEGPAVIKYKLVHGIPTLSEVRYYHHGVLHNSKGPAVIRFNRRGDVYKVKYFNNGEMSGDSKGRSQITYYGNNEIKKIKFTDSTTVLQPLRHVNNRRK